MSRYPIRLRIFGKNGVDETIAAATGIAMVFTHAHPIPIAQSGLRSDQPVTLIKAFADRFDRGREPECFLIRLTTPHQSFLRARATETVLTDVVPRQMSCETVG